MSLVDENEDGMNHLRRSEGTVTQHWVGYQHLSCLMQHTYCSPTLVESLTGDPHIAIPFAGEGETGK